MTVEYSLSANHLTADPNDQKATVIPKETITYEGLKENIAKRGNTLTPIDIEAVLAAYHEEVGSLVANGYAVITPLVNIKPSIQGVFSDPSDTFDSKRHIIVATLSPGVDLNEKMASASPVKKSGSSNPTPDIITFIDANTNTYTIATPGKIGTIIGTELKFNPNNPAEGVFFKDLKSGNLTQVTDFAQLAPTKLIFIIPSRLAPSNYSLMVIKGYTKNVELRSDVYQQTITVK